MPWQERTAMSLKIEFIQQSTEELDSMSELCRRFGISRKTGYKWLHRYESGGGAALEDGRRNRPVREERYESVVWERIFALREKLPMYGPRKLVKMLERQYPDITWPSASLVKLRLRESGYIAFRPQRRKIISERLPLREITAPNAVWSMDFKGWFFTRDGYRCEPLTVMDGYSRYLLACVPVKGTSFAHVKPELEKIFYEYGKPAAIRSDNGAPFGSSGFRGLSPLSIWLLKNGIFPEKITPGKPGENGRLERLHRTLKAEIPEGCRCRYSEYDSHFTEFIHRYNEERPHESLSDTPPSSVYTKSSLEYTGKEEDYEKYGLTQGL